MQSISYTIYVGVPKKCMHTLAPDSSILKVKIELSILITAFIVIQSIHFGGQPIFKYYIHYEDVYIYMNIYLYIYI